MAIVDLDKVILKKVSVGITCSSCGGNLKNSLSQSAILKIISALSLGVLKVTSYKCTNCKRKFILI